MDYDPTIVSYDELLVAFWGAHAPAFPAYSRQYRSAVFYHNDEQRQTAIASKEQVRASMGREIHTAIEPISAFYLAEDYHQKYYLQANKDLMKELRAVYPVFADLINSTAAARLNGYLGGEGSLAGLESALRDAGLAPDATARLVELAR